MLQTKHTKLERSGMPRIGTRVSLKEHKGCAPFHRKHTKLPFIQ